MAIEINTKVSVADSVRGGPGNITLEDAKFFGRPNFRGEVDQFKDDRRKFTVLIPNDVADQLRALGWNVKTLMPQEEGQEEISILKVMVDDISDIFLKQGTNTEKLEPPMFMVVDRTRFELIDMEIRAWEYNKEDHPGKYSARLSTFVGVMPESSLANKYGDLR